VIGVHSTTLNKRGYDDNQDTAPIEASDREIPYYPPHH